MCLFKILYINVREFIMGITVQELTTKFHNITDSEIAKLVGKENFKDSDVIPLNNFAECSKMAYKNFAAEKVGKTFLGYLKGQEQINVARNAGITLFPANATVNPFVPATQQQMNSTVIPMGQSLFSMNRRAV